MATAGMAHAGFFPDGADSGGGAAGGGAVGADEACATARLVEGFVTTASGSNF